MTRAPGTEWWREAVVYQVYPRSFADGDGDGEGDLRGVVARLDHLARLGVDALWLNPFYPSPGVDGGYDIADHRAVDPRYGTLADFDALVAAAHGRGIRVTVDVVPNHVSDAHPWFRAAVAAGPGTPERARFHFRPGRGAGAHEPPTNWTSVFGGPSWTRVAEPDGTPGEWYYHLFAPEQPDLNWDNPEVLAEFERVLRFWLDRGVDGFRIDVADALIKDTTWPDTPGGWPVIVKDAASPVHDIHRALRRVLDGYPGDRMAVVETGAPDEVVALFLRPDEMHLAFNLRFAKAAWDAGEFRAAIADSLAADAAVGAPVTWVLDNHDNPRSVTRFATGVRLEGAYVPVATPSAAPAVPSAVPSAAPAVPSAAPALALAGAGVDAARGLRRARAASLLMLALPGAAYLYQGQELGLPNVDDLPDGVLQDPVFRRSGGAARGRDGCRVPLPWSGRVPPFSFSPDGVAPWLPQPPAWRDLTVAAQEKDPASTLWLHRRALALRRSEPSMRGGSITWLEPATPGEAVLRLGREADEGRPLVVVTNFGADPVPLPTGEVLLASVGVPLRGCLPGEATAIIAVARCGDGRRLDSWAGDTFGRLALSG